MKINGFKNDKYGYQFLLNQTKGTVVNRQGRSFSGGSVEITVTNPLNFIKKLDKYKTYYMKESDENIDLKINKK